MPMQRHVPVCIVMCGIPPNSKLLLKIFRRSESGRAVERWTSSINCLQRTWKQNQVPLIFHYLKNFSSRTNKKRRPITWWSCSEYLGPVCHMLICFMAFVDIKATWLHSYCSAMQISALLRENKKLSKTKFIYPPTYVIITNNVNLLYFFLPAVLVWLDHSFQARRE